MSWSGPPTELGSSWRVSCPVPAAPVPHGLGARRPSERWHSPASQWEHLGAENTPTIARTEELLARLREGHAPGSLSQQTMFAGRSAAPGKTLPRPTSASSSLATRRRIWADATKRVQQEGPEGMFARLARPKQSRAAFGKALTKWGAQYGGGSITTAPQRPRR